MPPVTCYICGRDFGSRSIGIHLPSCQKKWEAQQVSRRRGNEETLEIYVSGETAQGEEEAAAHGS